MIKKKADFFDPPVTVTIGDASFPPKLHAWALPMKDATLGALSRYASAIWSSPDPLNTTKELAKGLALHHLETSELIKGNPGIVTYVSSVDAAGNSSTLTDIACYVEPSTGHLIGLKQSGALACSPSGSFVVVPISKGGYISQIKLAYSYDGLFVGRLVFYWKANTTAKPVALACGSAGGKAVDLLPNAEDFVVTRFGVGCAPLPQIDGGSGSGGNGRRLRRSRRLQEALLGVTTGSIHVDAAPLAVLPVDPETGAPTVPPGVGDIIVPENPQPVPTETPPSDDVAAPPGPPGKRKGAFFGSFLFGVAFSSHFFSH